MLFVQHPCCWFQKTQVENTNVWSKGGLQQKVFFYNLCFVKLPFFCPFCGRILVDVQKHYKIGISAHYQKQKMTMLKGYYLGQVRVIIWAKFVAT